jgi:DNA phosphorothioation-dependent restriction protein DptH
LDGVVVIDLAALGADDKAKNMLVAIILNMFYENMLRIEKRPYLGTDPQLRAVDSFLLVDEADNIMKYEFDVLRKLLLQGREFGVGVILSSQYLSHFKSGATNYREPLLTWFIHKVPNITPSELQSIGMTTQPASVADRIRALKAHGCLYKSYDGAGEFIEGTPFFKMGEDNDSNL